MILSNGEIISGIHNGYFSIDPLMHEDVSKAPYNTTAIDLRLDSEIRSFRNEEQPIVIDLTRPGIAN